ncbi:MAG: SDR family NAD(P)-dependent oxidoreductase [Pseudomonadota bacterium]
MTTAKRRFDDKIALVTGASRGFGRAVAAALGAEGAQVVALARTVGGLEELDDQIQKASGKTAVLTPLDLKDGDGIDRLGAALFQRFERVDILVHAAAQGARLTPVAHLDPPEIEELLAVNATATHRLIRSIDPLLRQSSAPVYVQVHDPHAGLKYWGGYGASKAAAAALAQSYAAETPSVRVMVYAPEPMPTALRARTHPGEDKSALASCAEMAAELLEGLADA